MCCECRCMWWVVQCAILVMPTPELHILLILKKIIAFAKTNYLYLCTISNYMDHQFPREKKATKKG